MSVHEPDPREEPPAETPEETPPEETDGPEGPREESHNDVSSKAIDDYFSSGYGGGWGDEP